jgi:hypothetical protein
MSEDSGVSVEAIWLGTWESTIDRETAVWLRFFDSAAISFFNRTDRVAARLTEVEDKS